MILRINSAACPEHGPLFPEMWSMPFSLNSELLTAMPIICGVPGCESDPELAMEECSEPLTCHWADIGYDPDANPQYYPLFEVRPVERFPGTNIYRTGSKRLPGDPE